MDQEEREILAEDTDHRRLKWPCDKEQSHEIEMCERRTVELIMDFSLVFALAIVIT